MFPPQAVARIAREFAQNAADSKGRSMIIVGAGTNHWFHSDTIYRCMLMLTTITGCQGVNGGGWAHYVGQEKARPITGWAQLAFGLDWVATAAADDPDRLLVPAHRPVPLRQLRRRAPRGADRHRQARRDGHGRRAGPVCAAWAGCRRTRPSTATRSTSPTRRRRPASRWATTSSTSCRAGELRFACEDPDAPENWPRVLTMWRANLFGSSGKGNEYFLKHLLGTDSSVRADETPSDRRPRDIVWHDEAPEGKLDLLCTLDFRMTSSTILSDIVLPAATWYEKHDISTTDMHPFIHSFNPAIAPPWQTKTDWDIFQALAKAFSPLAEEHLGVRKDLVAVPLLHDTAEAMATPHGVGQGLEEGRVRAGAGQDDAEAGGRRAGLRRGRREDGGARPADGEAGRDHQGDHLRRQRGDRLPARQERRGPRRGGRRPAEPEHGHRGGGDDHGALRHHQRPPARPRASGPWSSAPAPTLHDLAAEHEGKKITFADTQAAPVPVITSPEWSGSETGGRRYSPFTINTERLKPWHTLTGRQHFYLDHDWMQELGETMPVFKPPLDMSEIFGEPADRQRRASWGSQSAT